MVLKEYKDVLGRIAGSIGILHLVIPAGICIQIIRQGNTDNVSPFHFIIGGCITLMKLRHGQLLNSFHMVASTAVGFLLCMVYLAVYTYYCDSKKKIGALLAKFMGIPLLAIMYTFVDYHDRAEKVFGTICTVMMFCLMTIPLFQMKHVIKQKHTGDMSLAMAIFGTFHSGLWFLYALALGNYIEIFSRLLIFIMLSPQLILFMIYPMPGKVQKPEKETKSD